MSQEAEQMAEESPGYHETKPWGGHPRWKCDDCAFDSLDEGRCAEHAEKYHSLRCDAPNCDFVTRDPYEAKHHAETSHGQHVVLTDSYGRSVE